MFIPGCAIISAFLSAQCVVECYSWYSSTVCWLSVSTCRCTITELCFELSVAVLVQVWFLTILVSFPIHSVHWPFWFCYRKVIWPVIINSQRVFFGRPLEIWPNLDWYLENRLVKLKKKVVAADSGVIITIVIIIVIMCMTNLACHKVWYILHTKLQGHVTH